MDDPTEDDIFTLLEGDFVQMRLITALLATLVGKGTLSKQQAFEIIDYAGGKGTSELPHKAMLDNMRQSLDQL